MQRRAAPVLLALAVVLAGCGGFVGSSTPEDDATTTTTRPPGQVVPGVTEDGVTDPHALAEAHADALRNASYTANETRTVRLANGTVAGRTQRLTQVDGSRALFELRRHDAYATLPFSRVTQWWNGSASVARLVGPNGNVSYRNSSQLPGVRADPADWSDELYGYLGVGSFAVTGSVVRDGRVLYRVESTEPFPVASGGNASMWLLVDGAGLVHEYHLTGDSRWEGEPTRRTVHVRFTNVGSTTVERPSWVAEVRNGTS